MVIYIAIVNGSLAVVHHPTEDEELLEGTLLEDNRTGIVLGSQVSMNCAAETSNNALPIQISWTRDGKIIAEDSTHRINTTNQISNVQISNFAPIDVGVYQCIFNTLTTELTTTIPFRLQTGKHSYNKILSNSDSLQNSTNSIILNTDIILEGVSTVFLEKVSPEVIFLHPPEKLVIEIKATGRYRNIRWHKNGLPLTIQPQQFPNYNEILVYGTTTQDDLGLYEVELRAANPITQRNIPQELDFLVVPSGKFY